MNSFSTSPPGWTSPPTLDPDTRLKVVEVYEETFSDAIGQGHHADTARREALTAAAKFFASLTGLRADAALAGIEALALGREEV